jgi:hypothetical protein
MLIIILIIIIIVIAIINTKRDCEEKYINKPTVLGGNPPNYTDYNTDLTHISNDPSGEPLAFDEKNNFNYTQLYYAFLVQLFKRISEKSKKYEKKLVRDYAKNTIDYHNMDKLNIMIRPLLDKMNELSENRTDFWLVGYESWKIYEVADSPIKINQVDCFVYERVGWTQIRLLFEICELPKKGEIGKYDCKRGGNGKNIAELTTPEFPFYHVGTPSEDQLIPTPTSVLTSGNEVDSFKGVSFPIPCPFEKIWVNWIEIVNSSLVLNAFEKFENKEIKGFDKPVFDYTLWKKKENSPYQLPARIENQWITLDTQPKGEKAWPCGVYDYTWNSQGVQSRKQRPEGGKDCKGIRKGLEQEPLTTSLDPSMFNYPRGITQYTWLFANSNRDMGLQYEGY